MKSIKMWATSLSFLLCMFFQPDLVQGQHLYSGVWEAGTDNYALWAGVEWSNFEAKWKELSGKGLRLTDVETYTQGGKRFYSGVFRAGNDGHAFLAGLTWKDFEAKWKEFSGKNLRLVDVETYMDGSTRRYIGVWRAGSDAHAMLAGLSWRDFEAKWKELAAQNLRLTDVETYMDGSTRRYIGVWRAGSDSYALLAGLEWTAFEAKWKEMAGQNLRLVDMETYEEGGKRLYAGVWRRGTAAHWLWSGVDWENFQSKWAENGQNNLRLVDLETYSSSCKSSCLNTVMGPDAYNYEILGSNLHCNGAPNTCANNTARVTYRWPVVQYAGKNYIRLSVLYGAKDQIFTLPFKDKTSDMSTNGWRYSNGNWHYALDYSRKDGKTFQVCAAAPGRVVYIGWDDWSGGTMILSHDVGRRTDAYRTIYMHLRNGANNDCNLSWSRSVPSITDQSILANYRRYLQNSGCTERSTPARTLDAAIWGTEAQTINQSLIGTTVRAGDVLGWAGDTGPGGCGCTRGGAGPNTHLHLFFAYRDTDDRWYFFDPYGIYGTPDCYPANVADPIRTACSRYPIAWKGGRPALN